MTRDAPPSAAPPAGAPRPPRVRPFPLSELPRLLRVQRALGRALFAHLAPVLDLCRAATPAGWAEIEDRLGPLELRAQDPSLFPAPQAADRVRGGVVVALELLLPPGRRAWLVVAQELCAQLALAPEDLPALLGEALAGAPVRVAGVAADPDPLDPLGPLGEGAADAAMLLALDLLVTWSGGHSWARLLTSADLRTSAPPPLPRRALSRAWRRRERLAVAAVTLIIEAGHGVLSGAELAALEAGDVVMLDHFGPQPVVGGPVRLRLGEGAFAAQLHGDGVTLAEPFHLQEHAMAQDNGPSDDTLPPQGEQLLRQLPVQVTCEIGRVTLTGLEVLELRPGAVLPVGRPLAGPVDLTTGGRVIARGELVDVEGEIGVRITEMIG